MCTQTDLDMLSEDTIKSIVKKKPLSEDQARTLIDKEKMGRGRKRVMEFLALQARKARADLNLRHAHIAGIHLPEVSNPTFTLLMHSNFIPSTHISFSSVHYTCSFLTMRICVHFY